MSILLSFYIKKNKSKTQKKLLILKIKLSLY